MSNTQSIFTELSRTTERNDWFEDAWVSRQVEAMGAAWDRGERTSAAQILEQFPTIGDEAAIRLIYEEVCLRREAGEEVDSSLIVARYPRWSKSLRDLLECDRLLGPAGRMAELPEVGERLGPFRLRAELGRGASGRTYLATDPGLADRLVVLKVIPDDQDEHLALAQLRHTHIVPLFSEHSFPDQGWRVLCMPYLGGANLARILKEAHAAPPAERSGKLVADLIDKYSHQVTSPRLAQTPFRRGLEQATYPEAIVWIAACLADALHYAHGRGLVHMDVKPSNVLITVDGQPMLLDFHLARPPIAAGDVVIDRIGGTPGWMPPEQKTAMDAVNRGKEVLNAVDGRADIYALGLILREALLPDAGERKSARDGLAAESQAIGVSCGLCDIVRKCTALDPTARYQDADKLADDLRRHLKDLPLRGVRNRSVVERWRKWRRRHPGAMAWVLTALVVLSATGAGGAGYAALRRQELARVRTYLDEGRRLNAHGRFEEAGSALELALAAVQNVPRSDDLIRAVQADLARSHQGRIVADLHRLAEQIRYGYGDDPATDQSAEVLLAQCQRILSARARLLQSFASIYGEKSSLQILPDLLEVAAVWADLSVRLLPSARTRQEVIALLDELETKTGSSLAIALRRDEILGGPTRPTTDGTLQPRTAWEFHDKGRHEMKVGQFAAAADAFGKALDLKPQDFWSNFHQGICSYRIGRFGDAVAAFRACCALEPGSAICRYNCALAYQALGETDLALADYSGAIRLDPTLAPGLLNRGILQYERKQWREAISDFRSALAMPHTDRATRSLLHYNLALALVAQDDRPAALASAEAAAADGSAEARALCDSLRDGRTAAPTALPVERAAAQRKPPRRENR
jgi:serine/threonine protein kinase/Flp pilus assembly protein TadD